MGGGRLQTKKIIYIVDDDESVCQALKILLMTFGFEVKTFNSAKSFFAISHDESGCLVLDINMPEVDGWAVLKRVLSSGSKLPIIFISADKYENITDHALKAGLWVSYKNLLIARRWLTLLLLRQKVMKG